MQRYQEYLSSLHRTSIKIYSLCSVEHHNHSFIFLITLGRINGGDGKIIFSLCTQNILFLFPKVDRVLQLAAKKLNSVEERHAFNYWVRILYMSVPFSCQGETFHVVR